MTTRLRLLIALTTLCTLPACDPRLTPYVDVKDLAPQVNGTGVIAEQGNAQDQYDLGVRYEKTVPPDYKEAVRWYRLAATQRHPEALYKLCVMSDLGRGLPQDYQEALRWCRLAADQGHGGAMFTLGVHYQTARGVTKDLLQAHMWYNLAAANGYEAGAKWRDRLAYDMPAAQITQAQLLARDWKPRAPERKPAPEPGPVPEPGPAPESNAADLNTGKESH